MSHRNSAQLVFVLFMLGLVVFAVPSVVRQVRASQTAQVTPNYLGIASIDQCYPTSNDFPGYVLYWSGPSISCPTRLIETWLKYDLSSIPPGATILSATLTLPLSYARVYATVAVYYASDDSWSGTAINWSNAPLSSVGSTIYSSNPVTNSTRSYNWDVTQIVAAVNPTKSRVTFVLKPTSSQNSNINGWILLGDGTYSVYATALTVSYSYASTIVSLSSSTIQFGNSVAVSGSTDPAQSGGTMTLQYSTDQSLWNVLSTQNGGAYAYAWTPSSAGTYYVKSVWSISWGSGSYSTSSQVIQLFVTKAPSTVQLTLSSNTVTLGKSVTLTVTVISPASVSDGTIAISYSTDGNNWKILTGGTPNSGTFVYVWTPTSVASYYLKADWSGDANFLPSPDAQQTLTVTHEPTSIRVTGPSSSRLDQQIAVTATLLDSSNSPIAGAQLSFQLESIPLGTRTTDSSGTASLTFTPSVSAGTHTIIVTYAGSNQYQASSQQSTLVIIPWQLIISSSAANAPLVVLNSQNYSSDSTGKVIIQIPLSGAYTLSVNTPLTFALGSRYAFVQWGDGSTALTRNINIASDTSLTLVMKTQYKLTLQSPYGNPAGDAWYDSGSNAQLTIHSPVDQQNSTRRVFLGWTKNSQPFSTPANGSLTMTGPTSLQASWKKQYLLSVISQYGNPSGGGWNDADSPTKVSVQSPFNVTNGVRYVLTGFVGTGTAPTSGNVTQVVFTISSPSSLTFSWKPQYFISVQSAGGTTSGGGSWYDGGAMVTITATSPSAVVQNTSRLVFVGWTGAQSSNKTIRFTAGQPHNITANWVQQYYVTASSSMGQIGGIDWYNKSSSATIKVSPTAFGFLIQQVFNGWAEGVPDQGGVSTFVVSGPVNLRATWRTDYTQLIVLVAVAVGGSGAGGFYFVRKRKRPTPRYETVEVGPQPTEPTGQTVVTRQPQPEIGTSVYTGSACPVCGAVNPVGAVFCGSCGADLQRQ